jgi:hypothetical protein
MPDMISASPAGQDDIALIAVLTARAASAHAFEQQLAHQLFAHSLQRFEQAQELIDFVDETAGNGSRPVDAVIVDLRKFASVLPELAARRRIQTFVLAAYPADAMDMATIEAAREAGALILSGELNERESALMMTEAMVDIWFGTGQGQAAPDPA